MVMFSTLTERGATATLDALAAGATDYVTKPSGTALVHEALARVAHDLIPRILALVPRTEDVVDVRQPASPHTAHAAPPLVDVLAPGAEPGHAADARGAPCANSPQVVASSTGGPEALTPRPARGLTAAAARACPRRAAHAARASYKPRGQVGPARGRRQGDDEPLLPGSPATSPPATGTSASTPGPHAHRARRLAAHQLCRPAADVLFRSAVRAVRGETCSAWSSTWHGRRRPAGLSTSSPARADRPRAGPAAERRLGHARAATAGSAHRAPPVDQIPAAVEDVLSHATAEPTGAHR